MGHIDMDKIRRHYTFRGRVQGVGFRYRASYAASRVSVMISGKIVKLKI